MIDGIYEGSFTCTVFKRRERGWYCKSFKSFRLFVSDEELGWLWHLTPTVADATLTLPGSFYNGLGDT